MPTIPVDFNSFWNNLWINNPFFSTVIVSGIVSAFVLTGKKWFWFLWEKFKSQFVVTAKFTHEDISLFYLKTYLKTLKQISKIRTIRPIYYHPENKFHFLPMAGVYFFLIGKWIIKLTVVHKEKNSARGYSAADDYLEEMYVSYFGRSQKLITNILKNGKEIYEKAPDDRYIKVYTNNSDNNLVEINSRKAKTASSLVLKDGLYENISKDINIFINSEKWYSERSIPYHRGYLLYGPPGNGKTSLIEVIAGDIKRNIIVINLRQLDDSSLRSLISICKKTDIILFEDIDSLFLNRKDEINAVDEKKQLKSKVSFEGFLNILDGFYSKDGSIVFMTTNHIEKLEL